MVKNFHNVFSDVYYICENGNIKHKKTSPYDFGIVGSRDINCSQISFVSMVQPSS